MALSDSPADATRPIAIGKRILVVDDEPNICHFIKINLERQFYEVETAENGVQALAHIKENRPDLLIIDVHMPEMGGFELIKIIRSDATISDLPIIAMASKVADKPFPDTDYFISHGANRVITKPFNPKELLAFLRLMLLKSPAKDE